MENQNSALNLLIIFGGRSCEHVVSVISAKSLLDAIDPSQFKFQLLGITEQGQWRWAQNSSINSLLIKGKVDPAAGLPVTPDLNAPGRFIRQDNGEHFSFSADVILPMLHGTYGEDGAIQGLLEMFDVPYVGCGVAASACAMDKLISKVLFEKAKLEQAPYVCVHQWEWSQDSAAIINQIAQSLRYPLFVKPANLGSSVGISKVADSNSLQSAIDEAFTFDHKILVENGIEHAMEVECAVLGNDDPKTSVIGEIRPSTAFYDYRSKYIDDSASIIIPAPICDKTCAKVQTMAKIAFKAIGGSGLARVDFFVSTESDSVWINEINTLPGFTPISMYPKLWQASGLPYAQLIDKLVALAIERDQMKNSLNRSFTA